MLCCKFVTATYAYPEAWHRRLASILRNGHARPTVERGQVSVEMATASRLLALLDSIEE
jgi:hypothetical protein